jgi:hypothetical protein
VARGWAGLGSYARPVGMSRNQQINFSMISPAPGGKQKKPRKMTGAREIFNVIYKVIAEKLQHR